MPPALVVDAHGFPAVALAGQVAVGLLPVLKAQFEVAHGTPGGPDLLPYADCCRVNPRASWRAAAASPEGHYLTGVLPAEAAAVAARLAPGGRLATADEWREADALLDAPLAPEHLTQLLAVSKLHPAARAVLRRAGTAAATWRGLGDGLLEWVQGPTGPGLYGRPRRDFGIHLILNPRIHPPATPRGHDRHRAYGLRLAFPRGTEGRRA